MHFYEIPTIPYTLKDDVYLLWAKLLHVTRLGKLNRSDYLSRTHPLHGMPGLRTALLMVAVASM